MSHDVADLETAPPAEVTDEAVPWRRLHPRMLLVHPFRAVLDLAPVVGVALIAGTDVTDLRLVLGVALALVVLSLGRWWATSYAVLAGSVEQRRGLLLRRRLSVPRQRIASADIEAPFLQRLLGLRIVRLTTASSMTGRPGHSIVLNAVTPSVAEALADDLRARPAAAADADVARPTAEGALLDWQRWWAVYAPFSSAGFVALGGFGIVVAQFVGDIGAGGMIATAYLWLFDRVGLAWTITVLVAGALAASALIAMGNYLIVNGRFTIERAHGVVRIHRGLLSRRSVSLDLAKLRGVELQSTVAVRLLGGTSTQAIVTGLGIADQAATSVLAPLAPRRVGEQVATSVLGVSPEAGDLPRHGAAAARRRLVRAASGYALGVLSVFGLIWAVRGERPTVPEWLAITLAIIGGLLVLIAIDRYLRLGHRIGPDWIRTREGSLLGRTVVLRTDAVIGVAIKQSLTQRWSGLATLTWATAAGKQGYRVLDLPAHQVSTDLAATDQIWWREWLAPAPPPNPQITE